MSGRIIVLDRVVQSVAIPIERLGILWSPRRIRLLPLLVAHLEPERLPVLRVHASGQIRLAERHGERLQRHAVQAAVRRARHDAIRTDEARQRRIVGARVVVQQARAVAPLPGEVPRGLRDAATAHRAPRPVVLFAHQCAVRSRRRAHATKLSGVVESAYLFVKPN